MPAIYDRLGVKFQYPENWELTEEECVQWPRTVSLQAPGGALWSVSIYPEDVEMDAREQEAVDALKSEYEGVETEPAFDSIGGRDATGQNLQFFYIDFVITAQIRVLAAADRRYLLFCQAEDREFEKLAMVFRAISESMVRNLVG